MEKLISTVVVVLAFFAFVLYSRYKNKGEKLERDSFSRYTIGYIIKEGKNFRLPNPFVVYTFDFDHKMKEKTETIPDTLIGIVVSKGGRYYVKFSQNNPDNCKLLFEYPVPDSIKDAPFDGWSFMPGYDHSNTIK